MAESFLLTAYMTAFFVLGIAIARTHRRLRAVGVAYAVLLPLFAISGFLLPIVQSAAGFAVAIATAVLAIRLPRTVEPAAAATRADNH